MGPTHKDCTRGTDVCCRGAAWRGRGRTQRDFDAIPGSQASTLESGGRVSQSQPWQGFHSGTSPHPPGLRPQCQVQLQVLVVGALPWEGLQCP